MTEIITRNNIKLKVKADNWEEAIKEAGKLMLKNNTIKEQYIENMIISVKTLGPYIVIAPHIAIAHARPDSNVLKSDISIITLENSVEFGNEENDPVKIVIAFSAESNEGHLVQLTAIAQLLEDEEKVNKILNSTDEEEVYQIINNI